MHSGHCPECTSSCHFGSLYHGRISSHAALGLAPLGFHKLSHFVMMELVIGIAIHGQVGVVPVRAQIGLIHYTFEGNGCYLKGFPNAVWGGY